MNQYRRNAAARIANAEAAQILKAELSKLKEFDDTTEMDRATDLVLDDILDRLLHQFVSEARDPGQLCIVAFVEPGDAHCTGKTVAQATHAVRMLAHPIAADLIIRQFDVDIAASRIPILFVGMHKGEPAFQNGPAGSYSAPGADA